MAVRRKTARKSTSRRSVSRKSSARKTVRGFKKVSARIERGLKGPNRAKRARAILAASSRRASPKAKRANPRLRRVRMPKRATRSKARRMGGY